MSVSPRAEPDATPTVSVIKGWLPRDVFIVDEPKAMRYLVTDVAAMTATMYALYWMPAQGAWWIIICALQSLAGFWMWCVFVIGHDCGHGTFSDSTFRNRLAGEITHSGLLLTPFYAWMLSHREHHLHHNHVEKDYSHMWIPRRPRESPSQAIERVRPRAAWAFAARWLMPVLAWPTYLYAGYPDGSHLFPFQGRLWNGRSKTQRTHALVSTGVVGLSLAMWLYALGSSFIRVYAVPWLWYSWFLFTVTYLQHHCRDTVSYDDTSWTFTSGAFETVDRIYGEPIDSLHHNISDGHVIHHMFFTTIPHYGLRRATQALHRGLAANKAAHHYKIYRTPTFYLQVWRDFAKNFYFAPLVSRSHEKPK